MYTVKLVNKRPRNLLNKIQMSLLTANKLKLTK